jgi:hypothetical protein
MLTKLSHAGGVQSVDEILFSTPFNYLFPDAARSAACLLPRDQSTLDGLKDLGSLMGDPGTISAPDPSFDSAILAAFTYLGQFIDHDLTARTDRNSPNTSIGNYLIEPLDPDTVVANLRNGRRPQLDLDSVFGDGPGLVAGANATTTESQPLYETDLSLKLFHQGGRIDLPGRIPSGSGETYKNPALIGDMRNDENVNVSQLHTSFLLFYNKIYTGLSGSNVEKHIRARQLVRWAYQFVVVNDYLTQVCDNGIVADTLANGPRYFGPTAGHGEAFMPLEFSVAGFRFGHSMIRPFYRLNVTSGDVEVMQLLGTNSNSSNFDASDNQLVSARIVDWSNFVGSSAQRARKIDSKIAMGLFQLPFIPDHPPLRNLAVRNLLRGYHLSIPHAQAVCSAFGVVPLSTSQLITGEDPKIAGVLLNYKFDARTPLWYYVLREAAVQQNGDRLGEIGSRIVCETIIGMLKSDPNSYLNNRNDTSVTENGIDLKPGPGGLIKDLEDLLRFAGAVGL